MTHIIIMLKKIFKENLFKICLEAALLLFSFFMGFYFQWEISNFIFFILFVFLILHPISSRFFAVGAIFFLITTAVLLIMKKDDLAEITAIWVYYFMIFIAVASFSELQDKNDNDIIARESTNH